MFPDSGPTARALLTLELLQNKPGISAAEIGGRLDVTERAARRTIAILREAGISIDSTRGPHGGYRLGQGLNLPPLMFTAMEAFGLVMAVLDGHHAADRSDEPVGGALGKLISALPQNVGRQAAILRQHAQAAPDRQAARPNQHIITALVTAVAEQRNVRITYRSPQHEWTEQVEPWGVVVRHARWYLVCHSYRASALRTYRVDRVVEAGEMGNRFKLPQNLDVISVLEDHLGQGWPFQTRVIIDAPTTTVMPWITPAWGRLTPHPNDSARSILEGTTNDPDMYAAEWLASLPVPFSIEGGEELRAAMRHVTDRLLGSLH